MGFQVVNTFSDGSDALAYLKEHPCDAVLTDILMSRMSGLEMIRNLHELHPEIKVVILSGHSDFAYAQQAIQYKVVHYLVKPVDEDELMEVFKGIKEQLDYRQEELAVAESETRDLKQMLQKSFFRDLLSGRVGSENELCVYLKLLGLGEISKDSQLVAFEVMARQHKQEDAPEEPSGLSVEDVFKRQLLAGDETSHTVLLDGRNDHWRVVFISLSQSKSENLRKYCNERMQALIGKLNDSFAQKFSFRLTHSVTHISELLAETKDTSDAGSALQTQQMDESLCQAVVADYKLLIMELDSGSKDTLLHILDGILYKLRDAPLEDVQFILKNLYSVIELNYKKRKINVWDITNGKFDFNHLYRSEDIKTVATYLKEDFCALCEGLKTGKRGSEHSIVGRLVQYLDEHLDEDIGHDVIATKYRIHPGYLSRLFKQEMGETLSEYLLRIRIEKAAKLLKEGRYKVGEIAGMVGYSTSSYFSIMFKKYTGYSPREYSQRISL